MKVSLKNKVLILLTGSIALFACNNGSSDDVLLAKAAGNKLYLSEIEHYFDGSITEDDSLALLNSMTLDWIKKQLVLREVESKSSGNKLIENKVEEYRLSLMQIDFEENLLKSRIKAELKSDDILEYYNNNQNSFELKKAIVKYRYAKIPNGMDGISDFNSVWRKDNTEEIKQYLLRSPDIKFGEKLEWSDISEIWAHFPERIDDDRLEAGQVFRESFEGYEYFLKIIDRIDKNEVSPLEYVEDKIKMIILQKRKAEILNNWKDSLFNSNFNEDNVKIYINE